MRAGKVMKPITRISPISTVEPWFSLPPRSFDAEAMLHVIEAPREAVARYCRGIPSLVKNIVALGALQAATNMFPRETFLTAVRQALKDKPALIGLNEQAFAAGIAAADEPLAAKTM